MENMLKYGILFSITSTYVNWRDAIPTMLGMNPNFIPSACFNIFIAYNVFVIAALVIERKIRDKKITDKQATIAHVVNCVAVLVAPIALIELTDALPGMIFYLSDLKYHSHFPQISLSIPRNWTCGFDRCYCPLDEVDIIRSLQQRISRYSYQRRSILYASNKKILARGLLTFMIDEQIKDHSIKPLKYPDNLTLKSILPICHHWYLQKRVFCDSLETCIILCLLQR